MQSMSEATSTGYWVRFQKMKCGSSNPGMWFVADYKALLTTKRASLPRKLARVVQSAPVLVQAGRECRDRGVLDQRGQLLRAALGFAGLPRPSYDRALWALRTRLDSWSGIGRIAVGMARARTTTYNSRATTSAVGAQRSIRPGWSTRPRARPDPYRRAGRGARWSERRGRCQSESRIRRRPARSLDRVTTQSCGHAEGYYPGSRVE
jgi:hypothetical protein